MSKLSPKDPDSSEWFNWDCRAVIVSGAGGTIASVVLGPFQELGDGACTVLVGPAIDATGYLISAKLGGCTDGVLYKMTVRFLTTMGETLDHSLEFLCANALT